MGREGGSTSQEEDRKTCTHLQGSNITHITLITITPSYYEEKQHVLLCKKVINSSQLGRERVKGGSHTRIHRIR